MKLPLAVLLILGLLVATGSASDPIRMWTENREFTFPAGVEAKIPLHIENSAGGEVSGTLRLILTDVIDGQESGQRTESRSYVLRTGQSILAVPAGASDTPLIRIVQVNLDYTAGMPRTLALEELTVRFVSDSGSPPGSATGPGFEAIPAVVQTSPIGSGNLPSGTPDPFQKGQMPQDIESLQRDLRASQVEIEENREVLGQKVVQDPSFVSINETLTTGGYTPDTPLVTPESGTDGRFTIQYRGPAGAATVQGSIEGGVITSIEAGSSISLPAPAEFQASERYRERMTELAGEGFTPTGTRINITGNEVTLTREFSGKDSGSAVLTARSRNGVVQSVGVEKGSGLIDYPSFIALVLLLLAMALLLVWHRRKAPGRADEMGEKIPNAAQSQDPSAVVLGMIGEAEILSSQGNLPAAYRKAGHALRYLISHRHGTGAELTDTDAIGLLRDLKSPFLSGVSQIILRCRNVGFARGEASPEEFQGLLDELSELVRRI